MRTTLVLACRPAHEPLGATGRRGMHAWRAANPLAVALYFGIRYVRVARERSARVDVSGGSLSEFFYTIFRRLSPPKDK